MFPSDPFFRWIDSSLITALLQAQSSRPVRSFTIGFEEDGFNEAPFARAVASHLGTDHIETILTSSDACRLIPQLPHLYSEPFADSSQLPTHLVCREARQSGLTVALSGDGGDELFGGYTRYFQGPRIWNKISWLPPSLRYIFGQTIAQIKPAVWDWLGKPMPVNHMVHKGHKLASFLCHVNSSDDLYCNLVSMWSETDPILQPAPFSKPLHPFTSVLDDPLPDCLAADQVARMMVWTFVVTLPTIFL